MYSTSKAGCRVTVNIIALVGFGLIATTSQSLAVINQSQSKQRFVITKPWAIEPVRVISARTRKQKIDIGRLFDEGDDWLDGFTITVKNDYDKTVIGLEIELVFRRDFGDKRLPAGWSLNFGAEPLWPTPVPRDPTKIIKVGETFDLQITHEKYKLLTMFLKQTGFPDSINRVELVVHYVFFDDESLLQSGTFFVQDPKHPNDPTKKIPLTERPPTR
jgi:hypothetical protein